MSLNGLPSRSSAMRCAVGKSRPCTSAASSSGEAVLTLILLEVTGRTVMYGSSAATILASKPRIDRKSTRLNSSHLVISYAVFCLKKKKKKQDRYGDAIN